MPTGFERKWIICGACVAIIAFGTAFSQFTEPALLILSGVLLTAANMTMSYAYHAYQTEVFPTSIRARASGLVYSMSRLSAMFSGFIVAYMLRVAGVSGVFGLITSAMIIVIFVIATFGPMSAASRSTRVKWTQFTHAPIDAVLGLVASVAEPWIAIYRPFMPDTFRANSLNLVAVEQLVCA